MCGIIGAISQRDIVQVLLEGLKRLEYRGYDSAGVAVFSTKQPLIQCRRVQGKVNKLAALLQREPLVGQAGIAHTRWATHGQPVKRNAHPLLSLHEVALVHNGIIENYVYLRHKLTKLGYQFTSETDTEAVAHLIHHCYRETGDVVAAIRDAISQLEGAYALGIMTSYKPDQIFAVRNGSPLVVGLGINENFIASDQNALASIAQRFITLENGDIAQISVKEVVIINGSNQVVSRPACVLPMSVGLAEKGKYRHFMQKEIFQQPKAIADTLEGRVGKNEVFDSVFGRQASKVFDKLARVHLVACGTSYHAGLVAKYWFEEFAKLPCQVEVASEFRYRNLIIEPDTLFVTISQSGETADTLAALSKAKSLNYLATLTICNVPTSSLVRQSDLVFITKAGIEIGVASTKAFTTQLTALFMLMIALGRRKQITAEQEKTLIAKLTKLPDLAEQVLELDVTIRKLSELFVDKEHALFLGRGLQYPIALEGALKLKEISYIHAEAYPAGELKHGPLALVDKNMPVITVAPNDQLLEKLKSNLQEVHARGGQLFIFADTSVLVQGERGTHIIKLPSVSREIAPIIYTIPLQLLAYHIAVLKGTDIDQPRNLAKSVTVE